MERYKISENFYLDEVMHPEVYKKFGAKSRWFIDQRLVDIVQYIRTKTGKPITINTWFDGGRFKERGLRNPNTSTGAKYSQHKFGKALDFIVSGMSADEVREKILGEWKADLMGLGLTAIEAGVSWVHIDIRNTGENDIMIFYP